MVTETVTGQVLGKKRNRAKKRRERKKRLFLALFYMQIDIFNFSTCLYFPLRKRFYLIKKPFVTGNLLQKGMFFSFALYLHRDFIKMIWYNARTICIKCKKFHKVFLCLRTTYSI